MSPYGFRLLAQGPSHATLFLYFLMKKNKSASRFQNPFQNPVSTPFPLFFNGRGRRQIISFVRWEFSFQLVEGGHTSLKDDSERSLTKIGGGRAR